MERVLFSVFMCVYNKTELLEKSVRSVLEQEEASFELLILDNSDRNRENTWKILSRLAEDDHRIKIFQSWKNVGWAKGASILLEKAQGKYMTFLAADDFLLSGALKKVREAVEEYDPDILWVGNKYYDYQKNGFPSNHEGGKQMEAHDICRELGETIPRKQIFFERQNSKNIKLVMENVFYNSFFHYVRVEFLKKAGIDFFNSGYGDCAGMVKAMTKAEHMVILNMAVYGLTVNTSQSRGTFYWDGDRYIFSDQWKSVKEAYVRDNRFSFLELRYCATAILKNENGNIISLAKGCKCVNHFMNPVAKNCQERLWQIRQVLENREIQEMVQFYGRFAYEQELLEAVEILFGSCPENERKLLFWQVDWLGSLLRSCYCLESGKLLRKKITGKEELKGIMQALTDKGNVSMFGMGLFLQAANDMEESVMLEYRAYLEKILAAYQDWKNSFVERIWNGLGNGGSLKNNGKIEMAAFCKYVLEQ